MKDIPITNENDDKVNSKYTVYKGKKYKLIGKCKKCGKCCIGNYLYIVIDKKNEPDDMIVEDILLQNPSFDKEILTCMYLDKDTNLCKRYKDKPPLCKDFPTLYQELQLIPDCGLKWEYICDTNEPDTKFKRLYMQHPNGGK